MALRWLFVGDGEASRFLDLISENERAEIDVVLVSCHLLHGCLGLRRILTQSRPGLDVTLIQANHLLIRDFRAVVVASSAKDIAESHEGLDEHGSLSGSVSQLDHSLPEIDVVRIRFDGRSHLGETRILRPLRRAGTSDRFVCRCLVIRSGVFPHLFARFSGQGRHWLVFLGGVEERKVEDVLLGRCLVRRDLEERKVEDIFLGRCLILRGDLEKRKPENVLLGRCLVFRGGLDERKV
jgi:hypothetical protein